MIFRLKLLIFWYFLYVNLFLLKHVYEKAILLNFLDGVTTISYPFSSAFFPFPYFLFFLCIYPPLSRAKLSQFTSLIAGYSHRTRSHKSFCWKTSLLYLPVSYKRNGSMNDYHFQVSQVSFFTLIFLLKYAWAFAWISGLLESIVRR